MKKYAVILDNSWLDEISFDNERTWGQYLSWKYDINNNKYVIFSKDGGYINMGNYTSDKIRFITEREFDIYMNNYYLIHLYSDLPLYTSPEFINWVSDINPRLHKVRNMWAGINNGSIYYISEDNLTPVIERKFTHTIDNRKTTEILENIYWYKADGTKVLLRTDSKTFDISRQMEMLCDRNRDALISAWAFAEGTIIEPAAKSLWDKYETEYNDSFKTGSDVFLNAILNEYNIALSVYDADMLDSYTYSFLLAPYADNFSNVGIALINNLTF